MSGVGIFALVFIIILFLVFLGFIGYAFYKYFTGGTNVSIGIVGLAPGTYKSIDDVANVCGQNNLANLSQVDHARLNGFSYCHPAYADDSIVVPVAKQSSPIPGCTYLAGLNPSPTVFPCTIGVTGMEDTCAPVALCTAHTAL